MKNTAILRQELMAKPIAKIMAAYHYLSGQKNAMTKAAAIDWLAHHLDAKGLDILTLDNIPTLSQALTGNPSHTDTLLGVSAKKIPATTPGEINVLANEIKDLGTILHNAEVLLHARVDDTQKAVANTSDSLNKSITSLEGLLNQTQRGVMDVDSRLSTIGRNIAVLESKVGDFQVDEGLVSSAVTKVVADAFAPFRKAVEDANAQEVVADLSAIHVIERKTAAEVFGVDVTDRKGNPMLVDIWNHPAAPDVDPLFIWTRPILEDLLGVQETGENLWFGGDRGTGKSETARQFAARTGRNFVRVNYHKHSSADEFIGAVGLENGATVFKPGAFLHAYMTPSTVILNDEISNAPEGELATLNPLLEPNCAVVYGGAVRRRAPGVMIFAADNTLGCGDESGRYAGTRTMNSALMDRFARVLHFQYLPPLEEVKAVVNHTGCSEQLAEHVLSAIWIARQKVTQGEIIDAPSIRSVVAFIRALKVKQPTDAWQSCVVARQPNEVASP